MSRLRGWHRGLGLALAALWLVQALAGIALVFHWEIDDARVAHERVEFDAVAIGARVAALEARGARVRSIWSSTVAAEHFDVHYAAADGAHTARIDGSGRVLRDTADTELLAGDGAWAAVLALHTKLFAGETGELLIALSGVVLAASLVFGLKLAWPRAGTWRRSLLVRPVGARAARLYGWHRLLGLWLALPALVLVLAGTLLAFDRPLQAAMHAIVAPPPVEARVADASRVGVGHAIATALEAFPGATLSAVAMPGDGTPWYRVRVHAAGEVPRIWGTTYVYVSASDGAILRTDDARSTNAGRRAFDLFYPLHTGQIGGLPGRVLALAIGVWLATMIVLGVRLYLARR